ncbi:hypothetical protein [Nonomuraea jiangxiensis]|uniref:Uncharacterized protein n=1 Tax=Nonomuraea jiangxiensis TaxID=633440 RepID=A0A1G8SZF3_9ACTN|nr:hypothetical protein [Nonomuraea jiangxiensis]SDJ34566.1 hypothetical protein SAMN05421869_11020 [Nonomuraea jiangxiensis]
MGITLDPALTGMMSMIGPFVSADEDMFRGEGNADRTLLAGVLPAANGADTAVRGAQQGYRGESAAAMEQHWNRVGNDGGHITQATAAMRMSPAILDGGASVVSAMKVGQVMQAATALVDVQKLLLAGGMAAGAAASARILAARRANQGIMHAGREAVGSQLVRILRTKVLEPMRRIAEGLRRPGGPGGMPALAGAGGPRVPIRAAALRAPSGPRSVRDGMAQMGRRNRGSSGGSGGGGGGRRGGGGGGRGIFGRDRTGKIHGETLNDARGMTKAEAEAAKKEMEASLRARKAEEDRLGWESGHAERIRREERALREFEESMRRQGYEG